jgi:REP element-mobilizing transposase RayT
VNYNPDIHHRRSIRLRGYNYSQAGAYFVTICTQHRLCLFGEIVERRMILNVAGQMVETVWQQLPHRFPQFAIDAFVVMPNHVHGIIVITDSDNPNRIPSDRAIPEPSPLGVCTTVRVPTRGTPTDAYAQTLGEIVGAFKSITTHQYAIGVKQQNWTPFPGKLWLRNYYERIIRDEDGLNAVRQYIAENPRRWAQDSQNPIHL